MEIERKVLREDPIFENVIEQTFVAGAEPDGVVGKIGVGPVRAEINEKKRHAVTHRIKFSVGPFMSCGCGNFFLIEVCDVCIRYDHIGAKRFARAEPDSCRRTVFYEELIDGGVETNLSAQILQKFDQGLDQGSGSAHGEVNAPLALEIVDHGVDGGGLERIASDEERVKGEDFAESLVFHMTGSHLPNGSVGAKADQVGGNPEHVGERREGLVGQFHESFLEDGVGFSDKAAVAFEIIGKMLPDLFFHFSLVASVFEGLAVVPSDPIERFAGDDLDVVGGFLSGEGEKFVQKEGGGEDGGAGVVGESFVPENGGASSGLFESFEKSDVVTSGLEADGRSKAAETGTDDQGGGTCRRDHGEDATRVRRRMRSRRDREHQTRC